MQLPRLSSGLHPVGICGLLMWSCYRLAAVDVTIDYVTSTGWMISNNSCRVLPQNESSGRLEHLVLPAKVAYTRRCSLDMLITTSRPNYFCWCNNNAILYLCTVIHKRHIVHREFSVATPLIYVEIHIIYTVAYLGFHKGGGGLQPTLLHPPSLPPSLLPSFAPTLLPSAVRRHFHGVHKLCKLNWLTACSWMHTSVNAGQSVVDAGQSVVYRNPTVTAGFMPTTSKPISLVHARHFWCRSGQNLRRWITGTTMK